MDYPTGMEVEIDRARKMTCKDHKQRWVYNDSDGFAHISETAIPYRDAVSVYWMPIHQMVSYSWRPRAMAHSSIVAL